MNKKVDLQRSAKLVIFCSNSAFSIANFRGGIIKNLIDAGYRVVVVSPADEYVEALRNIGAEFVEWKLVGRGINIVSEILALRRLRQIYQSLNPSVAFHFTIKSVIYGAFAAKDLRIPFVSVITGLGYAFINVSLVGKLAIALYRVTLRWSTEIWFLNDEDRDTMARHRLLTSVATKVLPGEGINTTTFYPRLAPPVVYIKFLFIARMIRDKGIYEFIEAARDLHRKGENVRFELLGAVDADNLTAVPREEVMGWEAEGTVTYLGVTRDVRPHIASCDCVVLPSYREGLPRSLLEAAAMGKPVIATDVPGCRDVVLEGETGYLCRVKDAKDLAEKMLKFLRLPKEARIDMGARGRRLVLNRFDERYVFGHYLEMLRKLPR